MIPQSESKELKWDDPYPEIDVSKLKGQKKMKIINFFYKIKLWLEK
jgi:hypothetical protein